MNHILEQGVCMARSQRAVTHAVVKHTTRLMALIRVTVAIHVSYASSYISKLLQVPYMCLLVVKLVVILTGVQNAKGFQAGVT